MYKSTKRKNLGLSKTRLYIIWNGIKVRCFCDSNREYKYYGGRGIAMCKEWNDFSVFREWSIANGYKENLTIERIDNDGNYEPNNCKWIHQKFQSLNSRIVKPIFIDGVQFLSMSSAARHYGFHPSFICKRLKRGLSIEEAFKLTK